jgi:acyl carrier protein
MDRQQQIRAYIVESFLLGQDDGFGNGDSLLESGVIDSTGVLEIVGFLEKTFQIQVKEEDLVPENLDTIQSIAKFVAHVLARSSGQAGPIESQPSDDASPASSLGLAHHGGLEEGHRDLQGRGTADLGGTVR